MVAAYILFAVLATAVSAVTDEERAAIRAAALPVLMQCGSELGVTKEQVLKAKETKDPDVLDPCFFACFFKKSGIINENGMYDPDTAMEKQKKYIHGEDDLKKMAEVGKTCAAVNDKTVSDGAKGCDRSKLLVHCLLEHRSAISPLA